MYVFAETQKTFYTPPLSRVLKEGSIGDCPHCHSTTKKIGKFFNMFKTKKYCINTECLYHYFDIRKEDTKLDTSKEVLRYAKQRVREEKLNKILNDE